MQRMSAIASFQKSLIVGRLRSGPRLVGRIGSGVRVSDSFHILSCAVVCTVVQSGLGTPRTADYLGKSTI